VLNEAARDASIAAARTIRNRIGGDTPVTYLAFGSTTYFLSNPTSCRYPSPVFLQRSRIPGEQEETRSWRETLACVSDHPGEWLVWDTTWFVTKGLAPEVLSAITARFDCGRAIVSGKVRLCPRR
jgi:hypothetical protein